MPRKKAGREVQIGSKGYFWTPTRSEAADLARGCMTDYVDKLHRIVTKNGSDPKDVIAAGRELRLMAYGPDKGRVAGKNESAGVVKAKVGSKASPEELVAKAKAVIARFEKGSDPPGVMGPMGPHTQLPHPQSHTGTLPADTPHPLNAQRDPLPTERPPPPKSEGAPVHPNGVPMTNSEAGQSFKRRADVELALRAHYPAVTFEAIGWWFGLSRQRVHQIWKVLESRSAPPVENPHRALCECGHPASMHIHGKKCRAHGCGCLRWRPAEAIGRDNRPLRRHG